MRIPTREDIKRILHQENQPLHSGDIDSADDFTAKLSNGPALGGGDQFKTALPYGMVSKPPTGGLVGYFLNLGGSLLAPILVSYLDRKRPKPSAAGEVILYCRNTDGSEFPVTLILGVDGKFTVTASTKILVGSKDSAEPLVLGNVLKSYLSELESTVNDLAARTSDLVTQFTTLSTALVSDAATLAPFAPTTEGALAGIETQLATITLQVAGIQTSLASDKTQYLDTAATNIVSKLAFTERGT
ncbi:MAG: hypothetical protein ACXWPM_00065 [Bdellovibrionota bacterium]